jgi:predicted MFS family arabinose efflux permease
LEHVSTKGNSLSDEERQRSKRPGVWKLPVGLILVFLAVNGLLANDRDIPSVLQYSNETQRISGEATQLLILLLGVGLIGSWLLTRWKNRKQVRKQTDIEATTHPSSDQD